MITPLATVITILAVARITRLITTDTILDPPRTWILNRLTSERLKYLILCDWCMSVWIAAAITPIAYHHHTNPWYAIPALALAASHLTGTLNSHGGE